MSLNERPGNLQCFLDRLGANVGMFGMHFAPLNCRMLFQDRNDLKPNLVPTGEEWDVVSRFGYLGSCISRHSRMPDGVSSRLQKALFVLILRHM